MLSANFSADRESKSQGADCCEPPHYSRGRRPITVAAIRTPRRTPRRAARRCASSSCCSVLRAARVARRRLRSRRPPRRSHRRRRHRLPRARGDGSDTSRVAICWTTRSPRFSSSAVLRTFRKSSRPRKPALSSGILHGTRYVSTAVGCSDFASGRQRARSTLAAGRPRTAVLHERWRVGTADSYECCRCESGDTPQDSLASPSASLFPSAALGLARGRGAQTTVRTTL